MSNYYATHLKLIYNNLKKIFPCSLKKKKLISVPGSYKYLGRGEGWGVGRECDCMVINMHIFTY